MSFRSRIAGRSSTSPRAFLAALISALGLALLLVPISAAAAATLSGTVSGQPAGGEPKVLAEVNVIASDSATGEFVASTGSGLGGKYALEIPAGVFDVKFDPGPFSPFLATTLAKVEVSGSSTLDVTLKEGEPSGEDVEAPKLDELGIEPTSIDTSAAPQTVTLHAHITDNLSGFKAGSVYFRSPSGKQQAPGFEFKRVSGSETNGGYEIPVSFKQFSETGAWNIAVIRLTDKAGNERELAPKQIEELGLQHTVLVNAAETGEDTQPPEIDELAIEPTEIDTSGGKQSVVVTAVITDDLSGFDGGTLKFFSPSGEQGVDTSEFKRVAGNANEGVYQLTLTFPQGSESGAWNISSVFLVDQIGNGAFLQSAQIEEEGFPHTVFVKGGEGEEEEGGEDVEAPQIEKLLIEPNTVDPSEGEQTVSLFAHITDDVSGLKEVRVAFVSPSGKQSTQGFANEPLEGSTTNGSFKIPVSFKQFSEGGIWTISSIWLADHAGHARELAPKQIAELNLERKVFVQGEGDTEPPQLHSLEIEPTGIDTSSGKQPVFVTAAISDNLSGFGAGVVTFVSPGGEQIAVGAEFKLIAGNEKEGLYRVVVTFGQGSELGEWNISSVWLADQLGNKVDIPRAELEGAEMPHTVTVGALPPAVTAIEPSSGTEAGGTEVQISGSGFSGAKEVRFGSTPASEFSVKSPTQIRAIAPPGTGVVDVTVTTPSGSSEASPADRFSYSPQVTLTSSPNPSVHGQKVTFTAKVIPPFEGSPTPLGTVAFTEGSTTLGVVNLSKGTATFNTTALGAGKHPVFASYSGDANYPAAQSAAITQVVEKAATELTLSSSLNPAPYGSAATLKASVYALAPGAGTPAGTVTFREGETVIDTVQLSGHSASLSLKTLPPGVHTFTATYSGDPNNQPSAGEALSQTIVKGATETTLTSTLNPAPYGSAGTLKATVDEVAPSVLTPTGTVTFREGETVLATVPLSAGVAKYALKTLSPGSYAITAAYNGAEGYEGSESSLTQVITKAATELSLASTLNPAPYGSSATLKASVKAIAPGAGTPSGTVTFREGEAVLATVPLSGSTAKYAIKSLSPGEHVITATYNGDANYEPSAGEPIAQAIVKAATELTLTSSKNPAPKGSTGTLKATVKAIAPGGGTPAGTVTFREGETVLATIPLTSSSVTYPLKSLAVGTHEITASYSGNANYEESEDSIGQVITP